MGQPRSGKGTLVKRGDSGAPETFTSIYGVGSISLNGMEFDEADVTSHSSTGKFREFLVTLADPGTLEFPINYDPTEPTHIGLRNDLFNATLRNYQIVLPGGIETITVAGYVKGGPFEFPMDDAMKQNITIRLTGQPTFS
jgi:predicted secreted protein